MKKMLVWSWKGLGIALGATIGIYVFLTLVGLGYRGLRFLANYEDSHVVITSCHKELEKVEPSDPPAWRFAIETDQIPYRISKVEGPSSFWDVLLYREAKPAKDWCEMVGRKVSVLHYDRLAVAIPYEGRKPDIYWLFVDVFAMEASGDIWILPILTVLAFAGTAVRSTACIAFGRCC
jgi:hypothetical protein